VCWIGTRPRTAGIPKAGAQEVGPKPAGRRSAGVRDTDSGKRAGRRPVDAGPLPEDEAAVQALGRLLRSNRTQKGLYHAVMGPWSLPRRIASRAFGPPPRASTPTKSLPWHGPGPVPSSGSFDGSTSCATRLEEAGPRACVRGPLPDDQRSPIPLALVARNPANPGGERGKSCCAVCGSSAMGGSFR